MAQKGKYYRPLCVINVLKNGLCYVLCKTPRGAPLKAPRHIPFKLLNLPAQPRHSIHVGLLKKRAKCSYWLLTSIYTKERRYPLHISQSALESTRGRVTGKSFAFCFEFGRHRPTGSYFVCCKIRLEVIVRSLRK